VRIRPDDIQGTLTFLEEALEKFNPIFPFSYTFLDDRFNQIYRSEQKFGTIFGFFPTLAIVIACLGLLGLASFTADRKTKEIGIRKVLGASVPSITLLISRTFALWVLAANLIAWPVSYFAMNRWLQNFAYHIDIHIWIFLLAAALALMIAILTVGYQAIKTARLNPVDSLKYE